VKIEVPENHQIGMRVPHGGSSCAKCEYVSKDGKKCNNSYFKRGNNGELLRAPDADYCCDFYSQGGKKTLGDQLKEQKDRK